MAEDEAILRTSLVPTILRTIEWNLNRGIRDLQVFELGKVYRKGGERRVLILAATGELRSKAVHESDRDFNFFDLKGDVEDLVNAFNVQLPPSADSIPSYYHPGRVIRDGDVATFGELHPDCVADYKLKHRVYLAELDVELMWDSKRSRSIAPIPKYPSIRRDFSLLLNKGTRYAEVEQAVRTVAIPELTRIEPFDRLESGSFAESKYALAISLTYQSPERTLTDDEVDAFGKIILDSLKQRIDAELRQ